MSNKLIKKIKDIKLRVSEFIELTKVAISVSKALNSKVLKYDIINEFISQTSNSLNIILVGILLNNIVSANKDTAYLILAGIVINSSISEVIKNYLRYKTGILEAFRVIEIEKFTLQKISLIPVKYRATPEFKEIEANAKIYHLYEFFDAYISLISRIYGTVLTLGALTIIQPYILLLAIAIGLISVYLESKSRLQSFNSRNERNYYSRYNFWFRQNFKVDKIETLTDNVKINPNLKFLEKNYDILINKYKEWFNSYNRSVSGKKMWSENVVSIGTGISIAAAYSYGINGAIPIGSLVIFSQAYSNLIQSMSMFSTNIATIFELYLNVKAIDDLINFKVPETKYLKVPNLNHLEIEFQNVSFSYPGTEKEVLKNISFKISNRDKLGIIGENGAGKSTIIKLLFRIYSPTSGQILLNGINLNDIADEDYYQLFSVLGQDSGPEAVMTVEDIIYLGDTSKAINKKKIMEAAKLSTFHKDVLKFTDGYKQLIHHEQFVSSFNKYSEKKFTSLSGGQFRKLVLAKVFYGQKPIIVLDEPTSSIDPNSAFTIFKNLNALKHNQITLFITHDIQRMQLVANKVLVLKDGEVIEHDSTENLLKKKDSYLNQALKTYMETIRS
jgi:ABC-type multidrug transport system fused ATPase/permease subunit